MPGLNVKHVWFASMLGMLASMPGLPECREEMEGGMGAKGCREVYLLFIADSEHTGWHGWAGAADRGVREG